jgi:transposase
MTKQELVRRQKWRLRIIQHALEVTKSPYATCRYYGISKSSFYNWYNRYIQLGIEGLKDRSRCPKSIRAHKADSEFNINAVFEVLHSPPIEFGFNRTSWKLLDIQTCLKKRGINIGKHTIRKICKKAGYSWKKARIVLTSNDLNYRRKVNKIKKILGSLGTKDRFFSIDEYGPFAIKMIGGRRLAGPNEYIAVPQFQQSKGSLILTAALELSTNQVTHFYSTGKNTGEMIRLIDILLIPYKECARIYLSWDTASWHISKKLKIKVKEVNNLSYRKKFGTPKVILAPLPASSQFLNVIESVFSGMARAIIHNSNYNSVDEAKEAIDRYIRERNQYFQDHPKIAGNKIWGKERAPSRFSESHNCKERNYR